MQFMKLLTGTLLVTFTFSTFAAEIIELPFTQMDRVDVQEYDKNEVDPKKYTIGSVTIQEVETEEAPAGLPEVGSLGKAIFAIDKLVAFGRKMYNLAAEGKPVVTTSFDSWTVLPKSDDPLVTFYGMYGWSSPRARTYQVTYKNLYQIEVVAFRFTVSFQYNGTVTGRSRYLTSVRVQPTKVSVAWLYNFDAESELLSISNVGPDSYKVAGATFNVSHTVKTILKHSFSSTTFHVDGEGSLTIVE